MGSSLNVPGRRHVSFFSDYYRFVGTLHLRVYANYRMTTFTKDATLKFPAQYVDRGKECNRCDTSIF